MSIELKYTSLDGEEGFPGTVETKVMYYLNNENELEFKVKATTDKTIVINITNHSYFNLSGDFKENILNHYLKINADRFLPILKNGDISEKIETVENTVSIFSEKEKPLEVIYIKGQNNLHLQMDMIIHYYLMIRMER